MNTSKDMNNREIARLLREIAAVYEIKAEDRFRVRAYKDTADGIENSLSEAKDLWEEGKLKEIPGVGDSLARHLDELFRTGCVKHFDLIRKGVSPALFPLLEITGIGPKTAYSLTEKLNLKNENSSIQKLKEAIRMGKVAKIEGFGEGSQKKFQEAIGEWSRREDRMLLPEAAKLAEKVMTYLRDVSGIEKIETLGSLRRRASTVGDVDLAVATTKPDLIIKRFAEFREWREILASGPSTARAIHRSGRQVDIKTERPERFGSLLQHFTGSKEHNVHLREIALKKGLSLSEHGIKILKSGKGRTLHTQGPTLRPFKTEEDFYKSLGMQWIPPELREDSGELEAALSGKLPVLVELRDIKGDFHIHSNIDVETSHDLGISPLADIVKQAEAFDYEYIAISDHNPSTSKHNVSQIIDLIRRRNDVIDQFIDSRGKNMKISILRSLEIDILPDGGRAVPDEALELLDFAILSVHSNFKESREAQTARVLKALDHPKVKIFGHPTARKLLEREGVDYDWDKIFEFCGKHTIWLEINASPQRLDLPDQLVRHAVNAGVKLVVNTDTHQAQNMNFMRYGIEVARRGWAEKKDIANTMSYNEIERWLNSENG